MARWDYKLDGHTYGDVSDEVIVERLSDGRLSRHDAICRTGTEKWTTIERTILWDEHTRRMTFAQMPRVEIPKLGRPRGMELYVVWFVITAIGSGVAWNAAQSFDPEGNGMFNLVQASLLNHAWIQVVAALLSASFTSLFFAAVLIAGRIRAGTNMTREAHILIVQELRLTREALAALAPRPTSNADP